MLVKHQFADGHWLNPGLKEGGKMPAYAPYKATALNVLSLQVYYRTLATYKDPVSKTVKAPDVLGFDDIQY